MHRRIWGSISRRPSRQNGERPIPNGDSPEASIARGVRLFCEFGGPNNSGEEVLHLPVIVEAAESSPAAATEASIRIRKFLSKENFQRAYVQYNAIMLVRILADNPGKSFTRNIDSKFVSTVKELLRDGRDMSVQQILRETLNTFESDRANDETLAGLREMWKKEKAKMLKAGTTVAGAGGQPMPRSLNGPSFTTQPQYQQYHTSHHSQNYFAHSHRTPKGLPPPPELAQRVEEAKTSAKLLLQCVQSTPPSEIPHNDLIREFVDRCQSASRSIQGYINSENPPPDEDTLLTLIETNDLLATAMSRHQRAILQSRKSTPGISPNPSPNPPPPTHQHGPFEAPASAPAPTHISAPTGPPPGMSFTAPLGPPPARRQQPPQPPPVQTNTAADDRDPFGDHNAHEEDRMPPPLSPSYGLPPSSVSNGAYGPQKSANDEGGVYRPGYAQENGYGAGKSVDDEGGVYRPGYAQESYGPQKNANDEGGVYRPGYERGESSGYGGSGKQREGQGMSNGAGTGTRRGVGDEEEEGRRPVQYRF